MAALPAERYVLRLLWVFCGIAVLAFGVSLAVIADVIMNSGEAFAAVEARALASLSPEEAETLRSGLAKILAELECEV